MSAHTKREVVLPAIATTDDEWAAHMSKKGLRVFDIYAKWAGPCEPMQNVFKRVKMEYGENVMFVQAQSDTIEALRNLRNKSRPTFLFFHDGVLVKMVRGANAPVIEKAVRDMIEMDKHELVRVPCCYDETGQPILSGPIYTTASSNPTPTTAPISPDSQETLALIKPDAMSPHTLDKIQAIIRMNGFEVVRSVKMWMSDGMAREFYSEHAGKPFFNSLVTYLSSAPVLAMVLRRDNAVQAWRDLMGPASSTRARDEFPKSIRGQFGTDTRINAVFGSETPASSAREINLIFNTPDATSNSPVMPPPETPDASPATVQKCLLVVYPHAMGNVEDLLERVVCRGFSVVKREEAMFDAVMLENVFEWMKEVDEGLFTETVAYLASAPVIVCVIKGDGVIDGCRELLGPDDPVEARQRYPMSLRALYGQDRLKQGVHASRTSDQAVRDIQTFFPSVLKRTGSNIFSSRPSTASVPELTKAASALGPAIAGDAAAALQLQRTLALIKPDAHPAFTDAIVERARAEGFVIVHAIEVLLSLEKAKAVYSDHEEKPFYSDLVSWMSSAPVYAMALEKTNAIADWRALLGPTNALKARETHPTSLRAQYGSEMLRNAVHGSDSQGSVDREMRVVFGDAVSSVPLVLETTLALIKPDAYPKNKDEIMERVRSEGFEVLKEKEMVMDVEVARMFYREHEGKGFYGDLTAWMSSAPIYVMVLKKVDAVKAWRALAGPTNSERARESSPSSIRALFGTNGQQNAVHGSDSVNSAVREIRVLFGDACVEELGLESGETKAFENVPVSVVAEPESAVVEAQPTELAEPAEQVDHVELETEPERQGTAEPMESPPSNDMKPKDEGTDADSSNQPSRPRSGRDEKSNETGQSKTGVVKSSSKPALSSSKAALSGSKQALSGSKQALGGRKPGVGGSKASINGSKVALGSSKASLLASKAALALSKSELAASKAELASTKAAIARSTHASREAIDAKLEQNASRPGSHGSLHPA